MNQFDMQRATHKYVMGLAFNADATEIIFIEKQKPEWQRGKLNGVGGSVEEDETWSMAMTREFQEETGVYICMENWIEVADLTGPVCQAGERGNAGENWAMKVFTLFSQDIRGCRTKTIEKVFTFNIPVAPTANLMHNLHWLIPMARLKLDPLHKNFTAAIVENL